MKCVGLLSGNAPTILKYQAGASMANPFIPVVVAGSGGYGLQKATTIAAVSAMGVTQDTATVSNTQASDGADTERQISVVINPNAIYRARLCGGATDGTACVEGTEVTGSTNGLLVDTGVDYNSPSLDECGLFCSYGANVGLFRKVTSISSSNAVNIVAWPRDIAVGDKFIAIPASFMDKQFVQLTTLLYEVDHTVAVDTDNANFVPLKLVIPAAPGDYTTQLAIDMVLYDSIFASGAQ